MRTKKVDEICRYCNKALKIKEFHNIYRLNVITDKQIYFVGLQKLLPDLSDYAMERGYHLSASQILLLRPDIVKTYLDQKYSEEKVATWFLHAHEICLDCYKDYERMVPIK